MTVDSNHKRRATKVRTSDVSLPLANMPGLKTDVKAALEELCSKSAIKTIEAQTAVKWLSRALAAYALARTAPLDSVRETWVEHASDFASEAREHAALADSKGELLARVCKVLAAARQKSLVETLPPSRAEAAQSAAPEPLTKNQKNSY